MNTFPIPIGSDIYISFFKIKRGMQAKIQRKIDYYIDKIMEYKIERDIVLEYEDRTTINLECWELDAERMIDDGVKYFRGLKANVAFADLHLQYDLRPENLGRPGIRRVPFLLEENANQLTLSHLDHMSWCVNPMHHCLESLDDNKGRNGCPGCELCRHRVRCIRPGPYYMGESSISIPLYILNRLNN